MALPRHPAVEVNDPMTRVFLREHFQQCLFSGIIGGDVMDELDCGENRIQFMLQYRYGRPAKKPDPALVASWWKTDMGKALDEWHAYMKSLHTVKEEEDDEDEDEDED